MMWDCLISALDSHLRTLSGGEAQRIKLATELVQKEYRQDDLYFG